MSDDVSAMTDTIAIARLLASVAEDLRRAGCIAGDSLAIRSGNAALAAASDVLQRERDQARQPWQHTGNADDRRRTVSS